MAEGEYEAGHFEKIEYYPGNYIRSNWAPETNYRGTVRRLAKASQLVPMNAVAKKYFLANALVEDRRLVDFGVNNPEDFEDLYEKKLPPECMDADPFVATAARDLVADHLKPY